MKHTIVIDDERPKGLELLNPIRQFPEEVVSFVDEEDLSDCVPIEVWAEELMEAVKRKYEEKKKLNNIL